MQHGAHPSAASSHIGLLQSRRLQW